ncbi:MAG: hemerythrin domain-containing protein [Candidatus Thiodiazotropha sp. (ex Notomyrtea botanica)]|nr:hemerythrin domain-containing protein [Candidatus Thiodiazotropha sp. (ex Notomyrtea botanica)]
MIKVAWSKKFEVGHERIDFEHKIFLDLIREASLLPEMGTSRERVMRHLDEVKKYALFHFTSEENIMFDVAYPDFKKHRQEHAMLLALLDERSHQYKDGDIDLDGVVGFLFEWFALHTTQVDTRLAKYIAHGVDPGA